MKCVLCNSLSFQIICSRCQNIYLKPNLFKRKLPDGFLIFSFYKYSEIENLIKTKHTHIGSDIYKIMAKNSFKIFSENFSFINLVYAIPIDDHVKNSYSHTAILTKNLKSKYIKPVYSVLKAKNCVSYSTKSLDFRLKNPRDFSYSYKPNIDAIIVDDIVTTTTTINEAKNCLVKSSVNPLFALTLADARDT